MLRCKAVLIIMMLAGLACEKEATKAPLVRGFPSPAVWEGNGIGLGTEGSGLRLLIRSGAARPSMTLRGMGLGLTDWSDYDRLAIELWNSLEADFGEGGLNRASLEVADTVGVLRSDPSRSGAAPLHYGYNRLELPLGGLTSVSGRALDLAGMAALALMFDRVNSPRSLIITGVGLERDGPVPRITRLSQFKLFDFGTPLSPVFPRAEKVTAADTLRAGRGFGWVGAAPYMALAPGGPDPLTSDLVVPGPDGRGVMRFRVACGKGEKLVWCIGLPINRNYGPVRSYSIRAGGRTAVESRAAAADFLSAKGYFRWMDTFYMPGEDPWAVYINPFYRQHLFRVPVNGDYLDLEFENLSLFGLAVFPAEKESRGMKALQAVQELRRELYQTGYTVPPPGAPEEEKKKEEPRPVDYIVFSRDTADDVYPDSEPRPEEITATLDVVLARGEREHVTFTVRPFADLGRIRVTVDEPVNERGRELGGGPVEVRVIRYLRPGLKRGAGAYQPSPAWLAPAGEGVPGPAGVNRRFWLTVRAGRRAAPGEYTGTVRIEPEGSERSDLGLRVRVLPVTLPEEVPVAVACSHPGVDDINYYLDYLPGAGAFKEEVIRREVRDLKAHGFNGMEIPGPRIARFDGEVPVLDWSEVNLYLRVLRAESFGLNRRCSADICGSLVRPLGRKFGYSGRAFETALAGAVRQIVRYQYDNRFRFILSLGAGPRGLDRNPWNLERGLALRLGRLIEAIPGADLSMDIDYDVEGGEEYHPLALPLSIVVTQPWERSQRIIVQANLDKGRDLWYTGLPPTRFTGGFFLWRSHSEGVRQGTYEHRPFGFYPFDFTGRDAGLVYPSPSGPLDTPGYERFSRGIDDYRFLLALEALARVGPARGEAGRIKREITAYLKNLERDIPAINVAPNIDVRPWRSALNELAIGLAAAR